MRVLRHLRRVAPPIPRVVLTLGNFDGVHLGHQAILHRAVEEARARAARTVALTFEPHPIAVLAPDRAPPILQPLHDRLAMLRGLGLPTANLHPRPRLLLPPDGVYAVSAAIDGRRVPGVLNIGIRPTFGGARRTVEAHFLDFAGDLYRRWLVVEFIERLRGESAFAGPEALKAAIAADVPRARRALAAEPPLAASVR